MQGETRVEQLQAAQEDASLLAGMNSSDELTSPVVVSQNISIGYVFFDQIRSRCYSTRTSCSF
jgi:hypothetical protein